MNVVSEMPVTQRLERAEPPQKGRVMMVSTDFGMGGGAEEQVMLLSMGLRQRGWRLKIASLVPYAGIWPELLASDIQLVSLGMTRGIPDPRGMWRLLQEIRAFQPNVVHCHMPQANLIARAVRPFCKIPVLINTLHNYTMERINGGSGRYLELAHGLTDPLADLTTVICSPAIDSYIQRRAAPAHKLAVYHNGLRTEQYRPNAEARARLRRELGVEDEFVWLAVARFERAKDYPNLIRALGRLKENAPAKMRLLICGQGTMEEEIRAEIRRQNVEHIVTILGVRSDIPDVMNAADAFVLSSYLEGLPMVLLQAASIGMPMVATKVGGNEEVVLHGVNGFTAPPSNDASLAEAMQQVMALSPDDRERMAERGRAHARAEFGIEHILDRWEALYQKHLKEKSDLRRK